MTTEKIKNIAYWTTTVLGPASFVIGGVINLTQAEQAVTALQHLGYPAYFVIILGVWKVLGGGVVLLPGLALIKEWAYAGFGITILSASYSHLLSGDGFLALEPLITFAALILSYTTRPQNRTLFSPAAAPGNALSRRSATYTDEHRPIITVDKA